MIHTDNNSAYNRLVALRIRNDIHTNNIESFWNTVKRAYVGVFHLWSNKHLQRYTNEFSNTVSLTKDFIEFVCENANGKRLTYKELIR